MMHIDETLNYWWLKFENIRAILACYMRDNRIATVEEAIARLLKESASMGIDSE